MMSPGSSGLELLVSLTQPDLGIQTHRLLRARPLNKPQRPTHFLHTKLKFPSGFLFVSLMQDDIMCHQQEGKLGTSQKNKDKERCKVLIRSKRRFDRNTLLLK